MLDRHMTKAALVASMGMTFLWACGGSQPPPKNDSVAAPSPVSEPKSDVSVAAEVGGLNEEATGKIFERAEPGFERCFKIRAKQVEFLTGTARFFVIIGLDQKAQSVTVEESNLGDRDAEKCMQGVLMGMKWPKPVGGRTAHAHYTAAPFEPLDSDVREAVEVEAEQVKATQERLKKKVSDCNIGTRSRYQATAYIDTSGKVITASVTSPDPSAELAIDCLVDLVKATEFPSPGSYVGKVTFGL
ncbi:MAG: hypothetical protein ACM3ZE_28700 [Myxococcales bacterium]